MFELLLDDPIWMRYLGIEVTLRNLILILQYAIRSIPLYLVLGLSLYWALIAAPTQPRPDGIATRPQLL